MHDSQTGQQNLDICLSEVKCLEVKQYTSDSMIHMSDHYYVVTSVILTCCEAEWVSITHDTDTSLSNTPHHSQESQNRKSCFQARLSFLSSTLFQCFVLFVASRLFTTWLWLTWHFYSPCENFVFEIKSSSHFSTIKCIRTTQCC